MALTQEQALAQLSERDKVTILKKIGSGTPETIPYSARDAEQLIHQYWDSIPDIRKNSLEQVVAAAYEQNIRTRFGRSDIVTTSERNSFSR